MCCDVCSSIGCAIGTEYVLRVCVAVLDVRLVLSMYLVGVHPAIVCLCMCPRTMSARERAAKTKPQKNLKTAMTC